jgi:Xaa-Pro aminopeptidase
MSFTEASHTISGYTTPEVNLITPNDRRLDIDNKQLRIADLVQQVGCDGLLVLDPINFAWLTSGGQGRGNIDPGAAPALYVNGEGRWVICSNTDSQRLFDEEVDGLGFQVKEWPWHWGREGMLGDLCQGRKVACDQPFRDCVVVVEQLARLRRKLTAYEQACYRALGQIVGHALEATSRSISPGESEREIAGHLAHRLIHRGAQPTLLSIAADGRSSLYRQASYTPKPVETCCVLLTAAQKYGFCAMASRSLSFGEPPDYFRKAHDAACRVAATYTASSWPDAMPREILLTAQRVYTLSGVEHEWRSSPQGHITGRAPVELVLTLQTEELLQANWAITWRPTVGAALSCDTFLITEDGPRTLTLADNWPLKRIRVQGADFVRPDLLVR